MLEIGSCGNFWCTEISLFLYFTRMDVLQMQMQHFNKYQNNQDLRLPSGSDILPIYWFCRASAIYDLPINLRHIHKRVPALLNSHDYNPEKLQRPILLPPFALSRPPWAQMKIVLWDLNLDCHKKALMKITSQGVEFAKALKKLTFVSRRHHRCTEPQILLTFSATPWPIDPHSLSKLAY